MKTSIWFPSYSDLFFSFSMKHFKNHWQSASRCMKHISVELLLLHPNENKNKQKPFGDIPALRHHSCRLLPVQLPSVSRRSGRAELSTVVSSSQNKQSRGLSRNTEWSGFTSKTQWFSWADTGEVWEGLRADLPNTDMGFFFFHLIT